MILPRLAWHASGTFSLVEHNGGSNGAGLRHGKEAADPANAGMYRSSLQPGINTESKLRIGLYHAINFLLPIQAANPWITHADLWTLAGVEAIKAMGGPDVPWQPGRMDYEHEAHAEEHRGNISDR